MCAYAGGIFDDGKAVLLCQRTEFVHRRCKAEQMHRDNCFRAWRHRFRDRSGIKIVGRKINIGENRPGTGILGRVRARISYLADIAL